MKILFSHPTGNQNVRAALKGLYDVGILKKNCTSIAIFKSTFVYKIADISFLKELHRRVFSDDLKIITIQFPFKEIVRLLATKLGWEYLVKNEFSFFSIDAVYQYLDKKVAKVIKKHKDVKAIYTYEDGALMSFEQAKKENVICFYDLPIGYWRSARKLLRQELDKRPDWASTLTGFKDSNVKLERKDKELALADYIIVASSFTKKTLEEYPNKLKPIKVIPYGFPPVANNRIYENTENRSLKLLFIGGLSQRKGIANVLEAVKIFKDSVNLTIVGNKSVKDCIPLNEGLKNHNYIPSLPHDEILKLMQQHDVFVFPSLFEGFGLVITEAMSQGTPVITTNRTAGADFIENGKNGWLVEAGSTESLISCIKKILENKHLIKNVGFAAMETARKRPWKVYSEELASFVKENI